MKQPIEVLQGLYADESGQDLIEYALIIALIGLVAVSSLGKLGQTISDYVFQNIINPLTAHGI